MIKFFFASIILIHGLIHFMGFAKAFGYGDITRLAKHISKTAGFVWFLAATLFIAATILFLLKKEMWAGVSIIAVIISQILLFIDWKDAKFGTIANIIVLLVAIPAYAATRFTIKVNNESEAMLARSVSPDKTIITKEMLNELPPVVQKWLTNSGIVGKQKIFTVRLKQKGQLRTKPGGNWMDFEAKQYFTVEEPAFVWSVNAQMMPLITINGRDKFEDGNCEMLIKVLSLINVVNEKRNAKINEATMIRYLAETSWFPAAALCDYIKWEAIDSFSAKAIMIYKGLSASGIFHFNETGNMVSFTADRYYGSGKNAKLEKWVVETEAWKEFQGILVPYKSKVIWKLKDGDFNWANMELTDLEFNNTQVY